MSDTPEIPAAPRNDRCMLLKGSVSGYGGEKDAAAPGAPRMQGQALASLLSDVLRLTLDIHNDIADVFLNHQAHISTPKQSYLRGFAHGV